MKIVSPDTLAEFRTRGRCEFCKAMCRAREPHHAFIRTGMGGGRRLDCRLNLIALGSTKYRACECHTRIHSGDIKDKDIHRVIALRENTEPAGIFAAMCLILRLPKNASHERIEKELRETDSLSSLLARLELMRHGLLAHPFEPPLNQSV